MNQSELTKALVELLLAAVTAATIGITGYLIPWLRTHISANHLTTAERVVDVAVRAVAQLSGPDTAASAKFADALSRVRALGEQHGITLTDSQWQTLIEQEVRYVNAWDQGRSTPLETLDQVIAK